MENAKTTIKKGNVLGTTDHPIGH